MWIKQVVSMASPEQAFPPGMVREVSDNEGNRLIAAGYALPSEVPAEAAAMRSAEKAVAKQAKRRTTKK